MKKFVFVLSALLISANVPAQDNFDVYEAEKYSPMRYVPSKYLPAGSSAPEHVQSFKQSAARCDLGTLKKFIHLTNESRGAVAAYYGNYDDYIDLAARMLAKRKPDTEDLSGKRQMRFFQRDWNGLHYWKYRQDSTEYQISLDKWRQCNALARDKFVQDSLEYRKCFVSDSLGRREKFLSDSLYRADFRVRNNYDHVVFDAPHGQPVLCYRNGNLIDGRFYNADGKLERVYENGKLVHNYTYSKDYRSQFGVKDVIYDSVERKRYYKNEDKLDKMEILNDLGAVIKCIEYDGSGDPIYEESSIFYPDRKTTKKKERKYSKDGELVVFEYYSDGKVKQSSSYRKMGPYNYVIRRKVTFKDGYSVVEYYDFDGKLERTETDSNIGQDLAEFALGLMLL